jgi:hypothetical protein
MLCTELLPSYLSPRNKTGIQALEIKKQVISFIFSILYTLIAGLYFVSLLERGDNRLYGSELDL